MLIAFQTKPDDVLSRARFVLASSEIAQRLGIPEEAARALVKAASRELCVSEKTGEATLP